MFEVDLTKVKKNLQVKSTVYDLIIFLSIYELIVNVLIQACEINKFDFEHHLNGVIFPGTDHANIIQCNLYKWGIYKWRNLGPY